MSKLLFIGLLLLTLDAHWNIFVKAGKPGWAAIIPFYHSYIFSIITFGNTSYFIARIVVTIFYLISQFTGTSLLASLIRLAVMISAFVLYVIFSKKLAKVFRKNDSFMVSMICLPFIFHPILGYGDAEYFGPESDMFD